MIDKIQTTPFEIAHRYIGLKETSGIASNPLVLGMLKLDAAWIENDATAWCGAFVNFINWNLGLARSRSLAARAWLLVGTSIQLAQAEPGFDIVILSRGKLPQPSKEVIKAAGHVGYYAGHDDQTVQILGGNQGDKVSIESFPKGRILDVRRVR